MKSVTAAFLCLAICVCTQIAFFAVAEPDTKRAEEAAKEYKPGDGVKRLKSLIEEAKFGKILQWTKDSKVCLRRGTSASGACYALGDFKLPGGVMDVLKYYKAPYTANPKLTDDWYEAFYNCVAAILGKENENNAPVLILTGTGSSGTEKYYAAKLGIGDKKSFGKVSGRHGTPAGQRLDLPVQASLNAMVDTVNRMLAMVVSAFD